VKTPFTRSLPFYLGGFMGPFGTVVILPMFPELRSEFGASTEAVSWGLTAYTLPMAALLLVSGTIGERYGRGRVLRITLLFYTGASIFTAMAPTLLLFVLGRAMQGAGNAFFTPLLLAGLTDLTAPDQIGRRVGVYSSFQAAGGAVAPLVGGIAGDLQWRAAFWGTAALAFLMAVMIPVEQRPSRTAASAASLRLLVDRRVLLIGLAALFASAGPYTANVLVGLKARDLLGLSATEAGLLILFGSSAGLFMAPVWGSLVDRVGGRVMSITATLATGLALVFVGFAPGTATTGATWFLAGGLIVGLVVALQSLAALAIPTNRGGALSATMSFRFFGHAVGPLLWIPVFEMNATLAFVGAASFALVTASMLWLATTRHNATPTEPLTS
jgi:MFS family permease